MHDEPTAHETRTAYTVQRHYGPVGVYETIAPPAGMRGARMGRAYELEPGMEVWNGTRWRRVISIDKRLPGGMEDALAAAAKVLDATRRGDHERAAECARYAAVINQDLAMDRQAEVHVLVRLRRAAHAVRRDRADARGAEAVSARTWLCGICAREISAPQMKRHLAAHDRRGTPRDVTDEEWLAFLDTTGWPAEKTVAGALLMRGRR